MEYKHPVPPDAVKRTITVTDTNGNSHALEGISAGETDSSGNWTDYTEEEIHSNFRWYVPEDSTSGEPEVIPVVNLYIVDKDSPPRPPYPWSKSIAKNGKTMMEISHG